MMALWDSQGVCDFVSQIHDLGCIRDSHVICILGKSVLGALGRHEDPAIGITQGSEEAEQAVSWLEEVELKQRGSSKEHRSVIAW